MSKHYDLPTSRLICFGSAKVCTMADGGEDNAETDLGPYYND